MPVSNEPSKDAILKEIEARREEAQQEGQLFTPPPDQRFAKDLSSAAIIWQAWNRFVAPAGTLVYSIGIANPTPQRKGPLFAHVFMGPGSLTIGPGQDFGSIMTAVDTRFPRLTSPGFAGITMEPGAITPLSFAIKVPGDVEPSNYIGNCILFGPTWHDPRGHLDRSLFLFEVSPRIL